MNLTCKVCKLSSIYDAPQEGTKYVHLSCRGCKTEFLCCADCELQVDLRNRTFVRFGRTPVSYMRQHFRVAHRHTLSDKEIPTQDHQKVKRQRVEYEEVYSHEDHDLVDEHDIFGDSGGCGVDCNGMGDVNEDDTGDSPSKEEDYMDDKNLFNPLLIQNEMDNQLTEWDDIQNKIFECYHNYIMCALDPNSPPMEEVSPLDTDKDVADNSDMLAITACEDADNYYSYDDFLFLDTRISS